MDNLSFLNTSGNSVVNRFKGKHMQIKINSFEGRKEI